MFISGFEICDFNPMFSDVHNRINFSLHCDQKETITPGSLDTISGKNKTHIKWNNTKSTSFLQVIEVDENNMINRIDEALNTMTQNSDITHVQVKGIVSDLSDLFINTAASVFGYRSGIRC